MRAATALREVGGHRQGAVHGGGKVAAGYPPAGRDSGKHRVEGRPVPAGVAHLLGQIGQGHPGERLPLLGVGHAGHGVCGSIFHHVCRTAPGGCGRSRVSSSPARDETVSRWLEDTPVPGWSQPGVVRQRLCADQHMHSVAWPGALCQLADRRLGGARVDASIWRFDSDVPPGGVPGWCAREVARAARRPARRGITACPLSDVAQ